ncbi:MAG: hypothetical protein ACJ77N_15750 [Chloroflexota bacterium]
MIGLHRARRSRTLRLSIILVLVAAIGGGGAVATNAFGAGDRFQGAVRRVDRLFNPPPDRATLPTVQVVDEPDPSVDPSEADDTLQPSGPVPTPTPASPVMPGSSGAIGSTTKTQPTATPSVPPRTPVDVNVVAHPAKIFASEQTDVNCAPAGTQIVLTFFGRGDTSNGFQQGLARHIDDWESWRDSHNGGWGPAAIVLALEAHGIQGYEIRAYAHRGQALRDAAKQISLTRSPGILMAWRGAHTWVMSGYRADADPTIFRSANVTGAYILDPWYPRVSSIWGPSDPPGAFQNSAEMERNFLMWRRPEGDYPDRDGKFIVVVPTIPASRQAG